MTMWTRILLVLTLVGTAHGQFTTCCGNLCVSTSCAELTCGQCTPAVLNCTCNGDSYYLSSSSESTSNSTTDSTTVISGSFSSCKSATGSRAVCVKSVNGVCSITIDGTDCSSCSLCWLGGGNVGFTSDCDNVDGAYTATTCRSVDTPGSAGGMVHVSMMIAGAMLVTMTWMWA